MTAAALVVAMLEMAGSWNRSVRARAEKIAPLIVASSATHEIDPKLVAAMAFHESTYRLDARTPGGDVGPMQVRLTGRAVQLCKDFKGRLESPRENIECAVRILDWARRRCGGGPENYLGMYAGAGCGPSRYARRVLKTYEKAAGAVAMNEENDR